MPLQKQEVIEESAEELFNELPVQEEEEVVNDIQVESENVFLNEDGNAHYENVFVEENHVHEVRQLHFQEENTMQSNVTNDSDAEDYDIIEGGLHVTADTEVENVYDAPTKYIQPLKQPVQKQNSRLLKSTVRNSYVKGIYETNGINKPNLLTIRQNEKENMSNVQVVYKYQKPNPRSILKSSFPLLEENNKAVERPVDKRILKSKVASQARLLHNFIAKTTIIHAPVRQERLPRKQTIKPVQRQDEEIIVQEVVVSSNGFIETSEDGILKSKEPLQPTLFLNVSDSDDDYDPKNRTRRRRGNKRNSKTKTITITDSGEDDVSEGSVIELSDSSTDIEENNTSIKKKRGRPPKQQSVPENKCTKCSKTFPSQGSLKTHMQYHNFKESTLRSTKTENKCQHCNEVFKTLVKLNEHLAEHKSLGCTICKRIFTTALELSVHRRKHIKEKMCKSTIPEKYSPQVSKKSPIKSLKCDFCSRTFKDVAKLEVHSKLHKKFICSNCGSSFNSKIVLDVHVRENCVKIRKSLAVSPKKLLLGNIKCEQCGVGFLSHTSLFKHKVAEHGFETPDKSVLSKNKNKLCKPRKVFGGIPSRKMLSHAFQTSFRRKAAESVNKK